MRTFRVTTAIAVFALVVGVIVGSEADAIKSVTAAGGKVQYDKIGKKRVVGGVALKGPKTTDATLKDLLEFPALTHVELRDAPNVTAAGIAEFAKAKKLQKVELQGAIVSDDTAKALASATTLTELRLADGGLTDDGVKHLAALSKMQTLSLNQNAKVRGTTIPALVADKELTYLTISNCPLGDLAGWSALKKITKMTSLSLIRADVTDAGLKEIGQIAQLATLNLEGSPITETGLAELTRLKALKSLSLMDTKITEKAIPILTQMKQLNYLGVSEKQFGKDSAEALKKSLPKCDVEIAK